MTGRTNTRIGDGHAYDPADPEKRRGLSHAAVWMLAAAEPEQ